MKKIKHLGLSEIKIDSVSEINADGEMTIEATWMPPVTIASIPTTFTFTKPKRVYKTWGVRAVKQVVDEVIKGDTDKFSSLSELTNGRVNVHRKSKAGILGHVDTKGMERISAVYSPEVTYGSISIPRNLAIREADREALKEMLNELWYG